MPYRPIDMRTPEEKRAVKFAAIVRNLRKKHPGYPEGLYQQWAERLARGK